LKGLVPVKVDPRRKISTNTIIVDDPATRLARSLLHRWVAGNDTAFDDRVPVAERTRRRCCLRVLVHTRFLVGKGYPRRRHQSADPVLDTNARPAMIWECRPRLKPFMPTPNITQTATLWRTSRRSPCCRDIDHLGGGCRAWWPVSVHGQRLQ